MIRKFRAWDKKAKDWRDLIDDVFIDSKGEMILCSNGYFIDYGTEDLEISYSTGLKDKNGREIYEGDIVKYFGNYTIPEQIGERIAEVVFVTNLDSPKFILKSDAGFMEFCENRNGLEIIGNIYENPELIKKVNENEKRKNFKN